MVSFKCYVGALSFIFLIQLTQADVFASIAEMEDLIATESVLVSLLETYITAYEEKCDYLKRSVCYQNYLSFDHYLKIICIGDYRIIRKNIIKQWIVFQHMFIIQLMLIYSQND